MKPATRVFKKRPSRAGTRSVATLTPAQLERKRETDRNTQREIRKRTKDLIATLERQVQHLTDQLKNSSSSEMISLIRRIDELEQENTALRAQFGHVVPGLRVPEQIVDLPQPVPQPDQWKQQVTSPYAEVAQAKSGTSNTDPSSHSRHAVAYSSTPYITPYSQDEVHLMVTSQPTQITGYEILPPPLYPYSYNHEQNRIAPLEHKSVSNHTQTQLEDVKVKQEWYREVE